MRGIKRMYKHCDLDDCYISLHDCRAEKMSFDKGILSFTFSDGFWITQQHSLNRSENTVLTSSSQVDFTIIGEEICGIEISIFRKKRSGTVIREDWEPLNFINAVNAGDFEIEFITQYKSYQSFLFKCWVWFNKEPYHSECEIILHSGSVLYRWNDLRYDRCW